jgi:cellulose synthase/poly-beta-1,6-N-acetylglucosamine synthase-like glycosyltransferase
MMELLASITLALLALHASLLIYWVTRFLRLYLPKPFPPASGVGPDLPRAAVLLAVRGADPFLSDCLQGLLNQDYPAYDVCIIVDSREDASWETIDKFRSTRDAVQVRVHVLKDPPPTCSLKLSALLQAIGELDPECEIVALIDADVIPHSRWLRDLMEPLSEPGVGATSGIRWYAPRSSGWGTLVRYLWNAGATAHMVALEIPWGGSLAMRTEVLRRSGLLEQWAKSLFEDVACFEAMRRLGLTVRFVAAATMVNRETISLKDCFRFVCRQLLDARLYHPRWPVVLGVGLLSTMTLAVALALIVAALMQENVDVAVGLGGGLTAYFLAMTLMLHWIERRLARAARTAARPWGLWTLLALPLAQAVHCAGLVSACVLRRIPWRGITYEIDGPWSVRLIEYRPCKAATGGRESTSVS